MKYCKKISSLTHHKNRSYCPLFQMQSLFCACETTMNTSLVCTCSQDSTLSTVVYVVVTIQQ